MPTERETRPGGKAEPRGVGEMGSPTRGGRPLSPVCCTSGVLSGRTELPGLMLCKPQKPGWAQLSGKELMGRVLGRRLRIVGLRTCVRSQQPTTGTTELGAHSAKSRAIPKFLHVSLPAAASTRGTVQGRSPPEHRADAPQRGEALLLTSVQEEKPH